MNSLSLDAQQFSQVAQAYGGKEAHLAYQEEGLTELPYERWVQVRTPAFKAEFGDWTLAKENRLLREAPNKLAVRNILNGLHNITLVNFDSNISAALSKRSIEKIISTKAFDKSLMTTHTGFIHLAAAANVDSLFSKGVLGWVKEDRVNPKQVLGLARIFTPMFYENRLYLAQTTVKLLAFSESNKIYTVETINILEPQQIIDKFIEDTKKGNTYPITMAQTKEAKPHLNSVRSLSVSSVLTIAEQIIDFNNKPIRTGLNPSTFEPDLAFLTQHIPSPLIALEGLGNREAARKLHDTTGANLAHLPLIEASLEAVGKRIDPLRLQQADTLSPLLRQEQWLKAVRDGLYQSPKTQERGR